MTTTVSKYELTTSEKCRVIKKELRQHPEVENVRVYKSTGTASGWINIDVTVRKPVTVTDDNERKVAYQKGLELERFAKQALLKAGTDFYTFTSDDGYNSEYDCVHTNVYFN